jgi:hypothetical protein
MKGDLVANAGTIYRLRLLALADPLLAHLRLKARLLPVCFGSPSSQLIESIHAKFASELFKHFEEAYDTNNNAKLRVRRR